MKHYPSMPSWKKLIAALSVTMLSFSSIATANAAVLFQNDTEFAMDSDNLVIDFDDTTRTTGDVYIDFGNGAGTNGRITWSMDDNRFEISQDFNILSGGRFDASTSDGFRIREHNTNLNGAGGLFCLNVNSLAFRTDTGQMFYCDTIGSAGDITTPTFDYGAADTVLVLNTGATTGIVVGQELTGPDIAPGTLVTAVSPTSVTIDTATTNGAPVTNESVDFLSSNWKLIGATGEASTIVKYANDAAATAGFNPPVQGDIYYDTNNDLLKTFDGTNWVVVGPQDFESVFATDADGVLTTGNSNFTINAGTGDLQFNSNLFDVNSTSDITLTSSAGNIDLTATAGTLNLSSTNWSIDTTGNASLADITATGAVDFTGATSVEVKEIAADPNAGPTACTTTGELIFSTTLNVAYVCTDAGADTWTPLGGAGMNNTQLAWDPVYPNATIFKDGSDNKGTLSSDSDGSGISYYDWISSQSALNDIDVRHKFTLPTDFRLPGNFTLRYITQSGLNTNNKVDIIFYNVTDATTCTSTSSLVNTSWTTATFSQANIEVGCTGGTKLDAGDVVEIRIKMYSRNNNFARVGRMVFDYSA